jgi:RHS repeat-associated protein
MRLPTPPERNAPDRTDFSLSEKQSAAQANRERLKRMNSMNKCYESETLAENSPLDEVRKYLGECARRVSHAANFTQATARSFAQSSASKTSRTARTFAGVVRVTTKVVQVKARQVALLHKQALILLMCACLLLQPNAVLGNDANSSPRLSNESSPLRNPINGPLNGSRNETPEAREAAEAAKASETQPSLRSYLNDLTDLISLAAASPVPPPSITDAAVSRHRPALNAGRIEGSLRVFSGETYAINTPFQLTGDLYALGNPQIIVNSGASHGGTVNDGGSATPSNYSITLNGGLVLPGKIHLRADALALPADIPTAVPSPSGTRTVNINTPADVASIGVWSTVRDLNVTPANLVINVPPGNYRTFSINSASRLNFVAGTYNFSGTINLNGGASIQTTGRVDINIGQAFNLNQGSIIPGANTLPGDVHLNAISTGGCTLNGNSQVTGLIRCPNSTFNLNGTYPIVTGQVIANYLNINTGKITGNASTTPAPDTTLPIVSITSPANNSSTTSSSITVTGTASDPGASPSGIAQVTLNNAAATYNAGNGAWSIANVALAPGSNTLTARATDNAGNLSTLATITVVRQADTTAPVVSITSPANGLSTQAGSITVTGTAVDGGANATGVAQVTVNGVPATFNSQTGTWTLSNFSLAVGSSNPITAIATDAAGNASTPHTINVIRQPPADNTAPNLTITSPANDSHTESATTTVTGTVADPGQYPSGVAQVTVNGVPATINGDCTWTRANVPLVQGPNSIVVIATDNAGNAGPAQTRTIHRDNLADTQAPTITITSPANNFTSSEATITVSGTATDEGANATGVRRIVVNGREATYDAVTHQWTITGVTLNEGANPIAAFAEDGATPANRGDAAGIIVTLHTPDTKAPTVTITSPLTSLETYATTLNLAGTAVDDGLNSTGVQSVTVNGMPASYDAATGQWSLAAFPLAYGLNQIVVTAKDGAPTPNQGHAEVQVTRLQVPPPTVTISSPQNGAVLAAASITVAGSVSTAGALPLTVTVNGQPATVSGGQFTKTLTLAEGANAITVVATDALSQQSQSSLSVIRDLLPPAVSFVNVPASVQPGNTYQILVDAADNVGVADVEFRLNGQYVATATVAPYQFTLAIPLAYAPGTPLVLSAVARDLTNTTAVATAQTSTGGPGGISGYVFDDTTGYVLPAVNVLLNSEAPAATDTLGVFNLVSASPTGVVRLTKDGYTLVDRIYNVSMGEGTSLFDARLTPLDSHANLIGPSGGAAGGDGGRVQLTFNAGTLGEQTDWRVTSVSPQGLANLLPYGWSPVPGAVIDVRSAAGGAPTSPLFQSPAHLTISAVAGLTSATPLVLARYDEAAHLWVVVAADLVAANNGGNEQGGTLSTDLPRAGQYAFLVADTGSTAPPAPAVGQPLTAGQPADSAALDSAQASAAATPRSAVFSSSARSSISFLATSTGKLPSGVAIEASFGETYNLLGGRDAELVDRPAQDFVLYAYPAATSDQPNRLGAFFVAKPTRTDFTITEIFNANVHVEIRSGRQNRLGVLIDASGGELRAGDGAQLTIPAGSVSGSQTVFFNNLSPQLANVSLPPGYDIIATYDVDLGSVMLSNPATISVPGLTGDFSRIVVARVLTVGGQRSPKAVARAVADSSGNLTSTTTSPAVPNGVVLPGINATGRYVFIRVPRDFGYVKGAVTEASNGAALGMVKVSGNQTPFIDVTGADGQFVVVGAAGAGTLGANQIGAAALTTDATGAVAASLPAPDAVVNANIAVSAVPLQVESITPAAGAQNMIATTPVTITFNKPVTASSLTGSSLTLSTSAGNPVLGTITVLAGNRVAVFTPAATLAASTTYKVSVTRSVRDIYGHQPVADFQSTFSTAAAVTISNRLRPEQIAISYPDANGLSTISIPAGSVPEGSSILIINTTSGSTLSTTVGTGAVSLQIQARVGDELSLTITQPDGTQYRVNQAAYRRADGFVSVGANGGTITSDDGKILLSVPTGAISGQADLKLTTRTEADITIPRTGEMDPAEVPFGAGVRITASGNFTNNQELHLEVAAPAGVTEGQRVAFMKAGKITDAAGEHDAWQVITSGKVEGGKFKTMSPPFSGLTFIGIVGTIFFDYDVFVPRTFRAVVGKVTELVPNHAPMPIAAVCKISRPGATGPPVFALTAPNGRFGTLDFAASSGDTAQVEARDSLGRTKTSLATPYISTDPTETGLNGLQTLYASIQFPSSAGLPETLPALLQLEGRMLDLPEGQPDTLQSLGRVLLGSRLEIKTTTTPDVQQITGQLLIGGNTTQQLSWDRQNSAVGTGVFTTNFTVNTEGSYSVVVTTFTQRDIITTRATSTFGFVSTQNPNTRPPLDGPPRVIVVTPANRAQQIGTGTRIHLEFNEPVKNLIPNETVVLTDVATQQHLEGTITSGGLPVTPTSPNISNIDFQPTTGLEANKEYAVEVMTTVVDTDNHALDQDYSAPGDTNAQPFRSTFKTFQPMVLMEDQQPAISYRLATAGDLAITVVPTLNSSTLKVFDISDPQRPTMVGSKSVAFFATAYDVAEAEQESDIIRIEGAGALHREYEVIAVVLSYSVQDVERPVNLWIYSLDNPTTPELIGVSSLRIPRSSPSYPLYVKIHHKRAYVGNSGRDSLEVVDLEEAVHTLAESNDPQTAWFPAVFNGFNAGFNQDAKKQLASYRSSQFEGAPVYSLSVMDQAVPSPTGPTVQSPVVYVASNKLQLLSFDTNSSFDGNTFPLDSNADNVDDRLIGAKNLEPAGLAVDVKTAPAVTVGGQSTDIALLLGADRLWLFNVTNPRAPQSYPSRSFAEMDLGGGAARRLDVEGTLAYVMFADKVVVIDFSNPANPYVTAVITDLGNDLRWISVRDGFVYTLDLGLGNGGVTATRIRSSIGSAAAVVYVHGLDGSDCTNPVLISRADDHMMQPAETIFKVYGHDAPQTSQVIIRKETRSGDQVTTEVLATIVPELDPAGASGVVIGRARWPFTGAIDAAAIYTSEVVLDDGLPTQFRAKRVPIVFSHLIDQYQDDFGIKRGEDGGKFAYILGANALISLTINNVPVHFEAPLRSYGLHVESIKRSDLNLPAGRYQFKLTATLQGSTVTEEAVGVVNIENERKNIRQQGSIVVGGVEVESGNLGVTQTDIPEIQNRGLSLSFTRYYNSTDSPTYHSMGYGWSHNFQVLLKHEPIENNPSDTIYTIRNGDGSGPSFLASKLIVLPPGAVPPVPPPPPNSEAPYYDTLRKNADNSFDYVTKANIKYHFNQAIEGGSEQLFNQGYMGNLAFIEEPNGNRLTLSYDSQGRLGSVTDSSNRKLIFSYEQGVSPFVGALDTGATNNDGLNCTNKRFLRSLRRRFALAQLGLAWRVAKVEGPGGLVFNYKYDTKGNLERVERGGADAISQPLQPAVEIGSLWQYAYDPLEGTNASTEHLLKSIQAPNHTDQQSHLTNYEYEATLGGWMVKSSQMPAGASNSYEYTFTGTGQVSRAKVTDGRGNPTNYQFTETPDPDKTRPQKTVAVAAPRGAISTIIFDGYGNRLSETDPENRATTIHYDNRGNPDTQTVSGAGDAITTSASYDPTFSKPLTTVDGERNVTTYSLDPRGNVTRIQLPTGREVQLDYAANGDLLRTTDQYGFVTTYQYDGFGNQSTIVRQAGGQSTVVTNHSYDDRSRLRSSSDTIAAGVENTYDALDHLIRQTVTDPSNIRDAVATTLVYLPEGQLRAISQTGGSQTRNVFNLYDGLNRLVRSVQTPNGAGPFTLDYVYDANSNLLSETNLRGVTTTRAYDELNFVTSETVSGQFGQTLSVFTATQLDRIGNPVSVLNLFGKETAFEYDGLHRLVRRNVPGGFTEETAYDDNGNVTLQKDRNQRSTTFAYDKINRRIRMTDPAGHVTTWTYDDARRVTTRQSDPQGLTETLQADGLGRMISRQVKFGAANYVTTSSYNARTVQTTDARGTVSVNQLSAFGEIGSMTVNGATPAYTVQQTYGPFGGLKHSVDANGRELTYTLDGLNRATLISHAGGFSETFAYDGEGNVVSHTDLRGVISEMTYDNLGRPLTTVVQDGAQPVAVSTIAYDDSLSKETQTDANGHAAEVEYDGLRRLTSVKNAAGKTRTLQYDGVNLRSESDFKGATTSYIYDPLDRVTQITDRLGQVTNIVNNDSGGYTRSITNRRGNVTVEAYDPLQRLLNVIKGGQPLVSYEYDGNNNRTAMLDGLGNRTAYAYDKLNRVTAISHPANLQSETFTYDAVGNVLTHNDGSGGATTQTYDDLDHLKTRADGLGNTTKFKYDGGGLLLEQTEPKGAQYKTTYLYNALGSLKRVTDAKGGAWEFTYDGAQNLKVIQDALGRTVSYDYDTLNRLTQVTQPQQTITTYGYDENSNRTAVTDPRGKLTTVSYDALDRMKTVGYDASITVGPRHYDYGYDPEGNLTGVAEMTLLGSSPTTRSYARTYDARDRLTGVTDPNNRTVRFEYDAANNLKAITDAANKQTKYVYDPHNRLQTVTLPGQSSGQSSSVDYTWAADGLLKKVAYPSGMKREYDYDPADRLTSINNHINSTESDEFVYDYDANSNRKTETRSQNGLVTRSIAYDFDLLDRLTSASYTASQPRPANPAAGQSASYAEGTRVTGFDYDAVGNRKTSTSRDNTTNITLTTDAEGVTTESRQINDGQLVTTTAQFDNLNRLTQLTSDAAGAVPTIYGYDRNGNLTSTTQNNQVVSSYEYDGRDQLRRVVNSANQELARYDYDSERQRLSKTVGGGSLGYVYAGDQVVNEYGANNQLANRYDLGAGEVVRGEFAGEGERYYFSDGQGSISALAQLAQSPPASLTARYEYDAWGNYLGFSGASYNSIGYTGQRFDGETGLMPLGNGERYYSPGLGSFIQQDSFAGMAMMARSMNRYAYANNNPLRFTDPSGHEGLVADWLKRKLTITSAGAENSTLAYVWNMGANFVAGAAYDAINLQTLGRFGNADRMAQKAWNGEQPAFSDILSTNWYGGNQDGWNPGNLLYQGTKGFVVKAFDTAVSLAQLANPVTQISEGIDGIRDPVGHQQRKQKEFQAMWQGAKQWWNDFSGVTYGMVTDPKATMGVIVDAAAQVGPDKTAQITGGAAFDAVMIVDGVTVAVKAVQAWKLSRALQAAKIGETTEAALSLERAAAKGSTGGAQPHGFGSSEEFAKFGKDVRSGLERAGYRDVEPILQGSAVTGKSYRTGQPFDVGRASDFDVALASPSLFNRAKEVGVGLRGGGTRTAPLSTRNLDALGLRDLSNQLSRQVGREVNFMIYKEPAGALNRAPSIILPEGPK